MIRSKYLHKKRPILINNWEATYFDFNTDKLLDIAREAKSCGIEMLVMDDGWFGVRNSDNCSLGDWKVNTDKITGGLKHLVDEVNKIGLEFGIWFEPEMILQTLIFTERIRNGQSRFWEEKQHRADSSTSLIFPGRKCWIMYMKAWLLS